jgi:hypothetical protein
MIARSLLVGWALAGAAGAIELERLVGTGDVLPETPPGALVRVATTPHVGGENIVFWADVRVPPDGLVRGLWLWDGGSFRRVIDSTMPDGQAGILESRLYNVDETGLVAVNVEGHAMMAWQGGTLYQVALEGGPPPNGPPGSVFESFSRPVVEAGVVAFLGRMTGLPQDQAVRIYTWSVSGGLEELSLPGLCCFGRPARAPDGTAYLGATDPNDQFGERAIWRRSAQGELTQFFRLDSPPPGAPPGAYWVSDYTQLGAFSEGIVYKGRDSEFTFNGIFRISADHVETVILEGDQVPETSLPVGGFLPEYSASADRIAFFALGILNPFPGYFPGGVVLQDAYRRLHRVVYGGDILEGQQVFAAYPTFGALSGDTLAIEVQRTGDLAVWVADLSTLGDRPANPLEIPTLRPGALAVLIALIAVAGVLRARRVRGVEPAMGPEGR